MNAKNGEYFKAINKNEKKKRIYKSTKMNYLASIFGGKKQEKELMSEIF